MTGNLLQLDQAAVGWLETEELPRFRMDLEPWEEEGMLNNHRQHLCWLYQPSTTQVQETLKDLLEPVTMPVELLPLRLLPTQVERLSRSR